MNALKAAAAVLMISLWSAGAQIANYSFEYNVNSTVPDGNVNGISDTRTVTGTGGSFASITNISVTLDLSGGYNGDLFAYLVHGDGFVVLLNRPGVSGVDSFGYGDTGMIATFSADGANNVHFYQNFSPSFNLSGQLLGTWQPDGRNVDPLLVDGSEAPNSSFSSFEGLSADGDWTLFLADLSSGGLTTWNSWTLNIQTIPEPGAATLLGLGGLVLFWRYRMNKK